MLLGGVLGASVSAASDGGSVVEMADRIKADLRAWETAMQMFQIDDGVYPTSSSITDIAAEVQRRQFWKHPVVLDPAGRLYSITSRPDRFRITAADGQFVDPKSNAAPPAAEAAPPAPKVIVSQVASPSKSRAIDAPGTTLTVDKSGDDVVLSWTGTGTLYDGSQATDSPFVNAITQFIGTAGTSHTYVGAVSNSRSVEFFDVTDETESNRGGNWNGGVLPPPRRPKTLWKLWKTLRGLRVSHELPQRCCWITLTEFGENARRRIRGRVVKSVVH